MAFANDSTPAGWLTCEGQVLLSASYIDLFNVIGTDYNTGSELPTQFRLPDLRGYFVRGAGTNSDGTISGTFGAKQADEFKAHTHPGAAVQSYTVEANGGGQARVISGTTGSTGGTETRPRNIAMLYCIKY
jgi:microcystin-dependent protein